jgi:hypothetical protein
LCKYLLGFLVLIVFDVHAAVFCVSSGNALGDAMATARGNGEHDEIRVTTGTHTSNLRAPQAPQFFLQLYLETDSDKNLTISGGWSTGDSCATQTLNPSHTVLDALYFGPVFNIEFGDLISSAYTGTFTLKNMTLNRGKAFNPLQSTGIAVFGRITAPGSVALDNLHVVNGTSTTSDDFAVAMQFRGTGSMRFRNSIVSFNSLTGSNSGPVLINPLESTVAYISNNSIFANSGTSAAAGLLFRGGAGTVTNNAVADNTSTANPSYQFYSDAASGLTLTKNHFGSKAFPNEAPFLETDTTTGNALWSGLGVERIPQDVSPLRDSGNNAPLGGALAIDFRGNPRVVNTTIDRGASEAPLSGIPSEGPIVTDNLPVKGSTTWLYGDAGQSAFGEITFSASGGGVGGLTLIECQVVLGTVLIGDNLSQYVATGQSALPMLVGFDNLSTEVQAGLIFCSFQRSGVAGTTNAAYNFRGSLNTLFKDGFDNP